MSLEARLRKLERTVGCREPRLIVMELNDNHTDADVVAAYKNAGLKQRNDDMIVILRHFGGEVKRPIAQVLARNPSR